MRRQIHLRQRNPYNAKLQQVAEHFVKPAFKFWAQDHGEEEFMSSYSHFVDQLFVPESNVQVLNKSCMVDYVYDIYNASIVLGYIHPETKRIVGELTLILISPKK